MLFYILKVKADAKAAQAAAVAMEADRLAYDFQVVELPTTL